MSRPKALFSAPYGFLEGFAARWDPELELTFQEIWQLDELPPGSDAEAWLPNPGQHFTIDSAALDRFPSLRVISTPSTGTNHIDRDACAARGIAVVSLLDDREALDTISASAEFTFLLLLNALRRIDVALEHARSGAWRSDEDALRGRELQAKTVGLVGLGRIGRRVARWSRAFDADVVAYDPHAADGVDEIRRATSLEEIFAEADAVVICCALTPETTRFVTGAEVLRLPRGGVLVNTSRGEVLDEASVAAALEQRPDVAFTADVLTGEVRNEHEQSPLMALSRSGRILVTPHVAGVAVEAQTKAAHAAAALALRELRQPGAS